MQRLINSAAIVSTLIFFFISCSRDNNIRPVDAQEGIAYALPTHPLEIDGNLDDWPKEANWYSINRLLNQEETHDTLRNAKFKVAYNLKYKKLYVGVQFFDNHRRISDSLSNGEQDRHILYVDHFHDIEGSGVIYHYANERIAETAESYNSWDFKVRQLASENIRSQTKYNNGKITVEYEVELVEPVKVGNAIGLGHLLLDYNKDNTHTRLVWTKNSGKSFTSQRLGTVVYANDAYLAEIGTLKGQIQQPGNANATMPEYLRAESLQNPRLWFDIVVDSTGNYKADLPAGQYNLIPLSQFTRTSKQTSATDIVWARWDIAQSTSTVQVVENSTTEHNGPDLRLKSFDSPMYPLSLLLDDEGYDKSMIKQVLTTYMEYFDIPGISLAIIKDGKVKDTFILGEANTYTNIPLDSQSLFEAASISKPVFAFAVMRLVEKGIIDLDEPLYKTLVHPDVAQDPRMKLITARHVLNHTTGFPNWPNQNPDNKLTINFNPGTDYGYSGAGFEYLKEVVVAKANKDIVTILQEEVFDVFNMQNVFFKESTYLERHKVHGHIDGNPTRRDLTKTANVAASMHTNAAELAKFFIGIRNKHGLKSETYAALMKPETRTYSEWEDKTGWKSWFGKGIFLEDTPLGWAFGHSGNNGDFKCIATYFEKQDVGFVLMTNSNKGDILFEPLERTLVSGKLLGRK